MPCRGEAVVSHVILRRQSQIPMTSRSRKLLAFA